MPDDGAEAKSETLFWQSFLDEVNYVCGDAIKAGLPLSLVSGGLLMLAAKYFVLEAKVRGVEVPKIGQTWVRWCEEEETRLAELFAKKEPAK